MAYCQNCGANIDNSANFCPSCGTALTGATAQNTNQQWSDTAKTVGTVAGAAVGLSMLSRLARRRRRPPMMHPHGGPHMGMRGPGMHGYGGHGPMGSPGGRGRGPMGGPGGRR